MGLRPHQHYATVRLTLDTLGPLGFPVFGATVDPIHAVLRYLTERPFRDSTNEDVADALFTAMDALLTGLDRPQRVESEDARTAWELARGALLSWGGEYRLKALDLAVMGVPDDIGHSDGIATYTVSR